MTSTSDTKAFAAKLYAAVNEVIRTGNVDLLDPVIAPDAIDRDIGMEPGATAIKDAFLGLRASFPDTRFVIDDMIAEGDKVSLRLTAHATHHGKFMGIEPTNKAVTWSLIDYLRFENGKLVERWGLVDLATLTAQLA
ncbi:ester cyclase [soil metagenome]